jgi:FeS assembly SUF system protein
MAENDFLPNETTDAGGAEDAVGKAGEAESAARQHLESAIVEVLQTVYDPEIPVDIYELGLIYTIDIDDAGRAAIKMTLTSPACPVAGSLPGEVQARVAAVPGITAADVELVWDPPWSQDHMSEEAKLKLGFL